MELEIYNAFVKAGVSEADAKAAVESINREIDKRYTLHSREIATRGDIDLTRKEMNESTSVLRKEMAEMKTDLIKAVAESQRWTITSIFAAVGLFAAVSKMFH